MSQSTFIVSTKESFDRVFTAYLAMGSQSARWLNQKKLEEQSHRYPAVDIVGFLFPPSPEWIRRIFRRQTDWAQARSFVICKGDDVWQRVALLDAGIDLCLAWDRAQVPVLRQQIASLNQRARAKAWSQAMLIHGDVALNSRTFEVCNLRTGELINITRQEWMALRYLLLHSQAIVSKKELALHTQNRLTLSDHAINMHIHHLRQKLGQALQIETLPGRGYRVAV